MIAVTLALGSNLGDRAANLAAAVAALAERVAVERLSAVYETPPMYVTDQPAFLNMALTGHTGLEPLALLRLAKRIEAALGRSGGGVRFGPRPVDVDILFYGNRIVRDPELEIPHPRIAERAFVLVPLAEIAPDLLHPALGATVAELVNLVPGRDEVHRRFRLP